MLIRPDYCQSQPADVSTTTQALFDWHYWLPSIAAHMWMRQRPPERLLDAGLKAFGVQDLSTGQAMPRHACSMARLDDQYGPRMASRTLLR